MTGSTLIRDFWGKAVAVGDFPTWPQDIEERLQQVLSQGKFGSLVLSGVIENLSCCAGGRVLPGGFIRLVISSLGEETGLDVTNWENWKLIPIVLRALFTEARHASFRTSVMQLYDSYLADPDTVSEQKVLERVKLVGKGKITKAVARASSNCHTNWIKVSERILEALMEEAKERLSIRQVVVLLISAFGTETQVGALTPTAVRLTPDLLRRVLAKRSTEVEVAMEMYLSLLDPEERLLLDR